MILYSKKIITFIATLKFEIKQVLSKEVRLKVAGDRFYDKTLLTSYPLRIVVFNHKAMLGYFEPNFYELGFHECLMHQPREKLLQIIRHEIAHYLTYLKFPHCDPHGAEFKNFCESLGWGKEVYAATVCLEGAEEKTPEESAVLRRVQKLMALGQSSNANESELAIMKSQQLLLKHNIELTPSEEGEKTVLKRIFKTKRSTPKIDAIGHILETFFVSIVYTRFHEFTYMEILGTEVNVEIAEYVANFLEEELERLWTLTRSSSPHLSGQIAKNSFFTGLARGYCQKIGALQKTHTSALTLLDDKLREAQSMAYHRLTTKSSLRGYCSESSAKGQQAGKKLTISPGVSSSSGGPTLISQIR